MALKERHRSTIYQRLVPILGEEETEALMGEFPASEQDQLVTREFLRAELAELRTEMHQLANRTMALTVTAVIAGMGLAAAIG